ncbi:hypothetical protein GCM10009827_018990 [Dactylosporangium maewongense]|uniref:DUF2637 domain-containing protein n=1 Tax=Dactylosporangium maewongense TaxID=634393 RepID=A0ABN1ZVR5_9ACTN
MRLNVESVVLAAIVLVVAGMAGAASFTHVHDWTMANSPAGTADWFGWANAAISELVPIACALVIRRRRRTGESTLYPFAVLTAAVVLSLSAQLAVAKPGISGGLLAAVPALAFMALVKLVLSTKPQPTAAEPPPVVIDQVPMPEPVPPAAPVPVFQRLNGAIPSGVVK